MESYNATTHDWNNKVIDHIPAIGMWAITLADVHHDIIGDLIYAHRQWLKELEQTANKEWCYLLPEERNAVFRATRGGLSPWSWVHRNVSSLSLSVRRKIPDDVGRCQWGEGPSFINWGSWGYKHPPSTWGCTDDPCCKACTLGLWDHAIDDVGYLRDVYEGARKWYLFLPLSSQREFRRSPGTDVWREVALSDDTDEG